MSIDRHLVQIHFFSENKIRFKKAMCHVPGVGDEIRLSDEEFYTVKRIVWCYDEPEQLYGRANVEIERII